MQLVSSWHALGPAAVLLVAGEPEPSLEHWPVVAVAFAAQFAVDFVTSAVRTRIAYGVTLRELLAVMTSVYVIDAVLTPVGFTIAVSTARGACRGGRGATPRGLARRVRP